MDADADWKRRWFFYTQDVKPLWIGKKTKTAQKEASVLAELSEEESAVDLEGEKDDYSGQRLRRSAKLVAKAKKRDNHTCRACGFYYFGKIVHVHHLDPLAERKQPKKTKLEDLLTLCPNCHYIAHHLLRRSSRYKKKEILLKSLTKDSKA